MDYLNILNQLELKNSRSMLRNYDGKNTRLQNMAAFRRDEYQFGETKYLLEGLQEAEKDFSRVGLVLTYEIKKEEENYWERHDLVTQYYYTATYTLE